MTPFIGPSRGDVLRPRPGEYVVESVEERDGKCWLVDDNNRLSWLSLAAVNALFEVVEPPTREETVEARVDHELDCEREARR